MSPALCLLLVSALALGFAGCGTARLFHRDASGRVLLEPSAEADVNRITAALKALAPKADPEEARRIAETSVRAGALLAERYKVRLPPLGHNMLVNAGLLDRGLCWHWTWDLATALAPLKLRTFELHWGAANRHHLNEHNTIVVTGRGQPFAAGLTLDPWRSSGRITAVLVTEDAKYRWSERPPPAGAPELGR